MAAFRNRSLSWTFACLLLFAACGTDGEEAAPTTSPVTSETSAVSDSDTGAVVATPSLLVVVTTTILGDIVSNIVGSDAELVVLLPVGADPHDYRASAAQVTLLHDADLVVSNGIQLEEGLIDVLEAAEADGVNLLEVGDLLDPLPFGGGGHDMEEEGEHHDEEEGEHDHEHEGDMEEGEHDHEHEGDMEEGEHDHEHEGDEEEGEHDHEHEGDMEEGEHDHEHEGDEEEGEHDHEHEGDEEEGEHDHEHEGDEEEGEHDHEHEGDEEEGEHDHEHEGDEEEGEHDHEHEGDMEEGEHDHEHEGHAHTGGDPHFWLDPLRVAEAAHLIAHELAELDPSIDWEGRAESYASELEELDEEIKAILAPIHAEDRKLITNHDALGYFAARYGFEIVDTVIPGGATLADPSSAELAALVERIREEGVKAIFAETIESTALAEALAAEAGSDVAVVELYTGSLGEPGSGADSLIGMLRVNAQRIAEILTG